MWISSLPAQDSLFYQRLTLPQTRCSVEEALRIIEQQTGLSFSYNTGLIDKRKVISLQADQEQLIDLLKRILNDPSLQYSIIGRHVAIYRPYKAEAIDPDSPADSVSYFLISGRVFDKDTRQPLPFSTVYLVGRPIGTISNEEGEFQLKLNAASMSETLSISCIGYKNFSALVSSLINTHRQYFLETDIIPIQEVIIRKLSPVILLQNANNRINANYPREPAVLTSFYRETVQRGNHYTMVSEAIIESYKPGYHSAAPDRVKILKGRKNEDFSSEDSVILKLKAGLNTMLMLDVVKNIPDFLTGESLENYHYRLADIVVEDGRDHYAIEFNPEGNSPERSFYSGRIILDIGDLAFKWIEFQVRPEDLDLATESFIVKKPVNLIVKALKADYKVSFRKLGNRYYLHMIQCETGFKVRTRRQLTGSVYHTKLETVVIGIDTVNVSRFPQREAARQFEFFTDQVGMYDASFWGEYNFITPDESLEKALARLKVTDN
jgi:hypothetical protein